MDALLNSTTKKAMNTRGDHVWVVKQNVDAVLVLSCMLGLFLRLARKTAIQDI